MKIRSGVLAIAGSLVLSAAGGAVVCGETYETWDYAAQEDGTISSPETQWSDPAADAQWSDPAGETQWSDPAAETQWSDPASETQWSDPAAETQWSDPASETQWSDPAPETQWSDPAPETQGTAFAPETQGSEAAPETQGAAPAPETQWSEPAPEESWEEETWRQEVEAPETAEAHDGFNMGTEHGSITRNADRRPSVESVEYLDAEDAKERVSLRSYDNLPAMFYLNVPQLLQKPELPTGCEAVALTMALQYEGFDVDKMTIAGDFLIYNNETDNMALGYIGDPYSEEGAGCFAPAIAATANFFFEDQGADYLAYDMTGTELEELLPFVTEGIPVIIWGSMYMIEPEFEDVVSEYRGHQYPWYSSEHCMVLTGYNLSDRTLQINDPLEGIVTRDMDEFAHIYGRTGKGAVILIGEQAEE